MIIVELSQAETSRLRAELEGATTARVAVDEGHLKISADRGMWTEGFGTEVARPVEVNG